MPELLTYIDTAINCVNHLLAAGLAFCFCYLRYKHGGWKLEEAVDNEHTETTALIFLYPSSEHVTDYDDEQSPSGPQFKTTRPDNDGVDDSRIFYHSGSPDYQPKDEVPDSEGDSHGDNLDDQPTNAAGERSGDSEGYMADESEDDSHSDGPDEQPAHSVGEEFGAVEGDIVDECVDDSRRDDSSVPPKDSEGDGPGDSAGYMAEESEDDSHSDGPEEQPMNPVGDSSGTTEGGAVDDLVDDSCSHDPGDAPSDPSDHAEDDSHSDSLDDTRSQTSLNSGRSSSHQHSTRPPCSTCAILHHRISALTRQLKESHRRRLVLQRALDAQARFRRSRRMLDTT